MAGTSAHPDAKYGRRGDTLMAHVTEGEQIVPKPVLDANPVIARLIADAIRNAGADPEQYKVGSGMSYNPETGNPEFGFSLSPKKLIKKAKKFIKKVAPVALPIAAALIPGVGPLAGAAMGAAGGAIGGGGLKGTILGAASGGIGGYVNAAGGLTNAAANALNSSGFGGAAYDLLSGAGTGSSIFNSMSAASPILQALSLEQQKIGSPDSPKVAKETPFKPQRQEAMAAPSSLSPLAGFAPEQERAAIATKGVNVGLASDENAYYRNLLNRSLIGEGNKVNTDNPNFLMPIESQYFSQQGKNTSDLMKFLQGISA